MGTHNYTAFEGVPKAKMGYTYICDDCGGEYNHFPPFAGEFTEQFLESTREGGVFSEQYSKGQKVTICADCMRGVL